MKKVGAIVTSAMPLTTFAAPSAPPLPARPGSSGSIKSSLSPPPLPPRRNTPASDSRSSAAGGATGQVQQNLHPVPTSRSADSVQGSQWWDLQEGIVNRGIDQFSKFGATEPDFQELERRLSMLKENPQDFQSPKRPAPLLEVLTPPPSSPPPG